MKFKQFLAEEDANILNDAIAILTDMSQDELNEFGFWLYNNLFDDEIEDQDGDDDDFDIEEILDIVNDLDSDDLKYVSYMLDTEDELEYDNTDPDLDPDVDNNGLAKIDIVNGHHADDSAMVEGMSIKFKAKNRNKKKTKRFSITKAQFRAGKVKRKKDNRLNRVARKKNYRKNKIKIKKYQKSYNLAVKKHQTFKKIRR